MLGIFVRQDTLGFGYAPIDVQRRVGQQNACICFRVIQFVTFVAEQRMLAQHTESVRKALG